MVAFHGDPAIKAKYLARVEEHRQADELIKGLGWDGHRGCAVGCTLEAYDHSRYPTELGIPEEIAYLEDAIFEGLPEKAALNWPSRFLSSINEGTDLTQVWPKFAIWLLETELEPYKSPQSNKVVELFKLKTAGTNPPYEEWAAAAAEWAAQAAKAARAAEWAARAARAALEASYTRMSDKLVELLAAA